MPLGSDPETIETMTITSRYAFIQEQQVLHLAGSHRIEYIMERDMLWRWDQVLPTHPNGMRFTCFDENGDLLATNEYYRYAPWSYLVDTSQEIPPSVGGGFVVNEKTKGMLIFRHLDLH